jgi:Carboxypeptidase regulatory-like domain/TonB-dependent Receptor Plug Domain
MRIAKALVAVQLCLLCLLAVQVSITHAQSGNSSAIQGIVTDPSGAVVANAAVTIHNPVSGLDRSTATDNSGNFAFPNVPYNPYHLTVTAAGFASYAQDAEVRSAVPINLKITLSLSQATSSVTVEAAGDLVETDSTAHTDVDRQLFDKLPLESSSSSLSSLVTLASPGVAADSNGLFHGLGDHAENSFSVDGQPITDQQSKVFSNQIPVDSIASLEVIEGAPPAEYGDKTSLIINVTTRSGQGVTTPHGSFTSSYGTFGSADLGFDLAYGGPKWGNFISLSGLNTGRFLDPPELTVMHDKGNEENIFDRFDYQFRTADSLQFNVGFTRSWFQTPNSYDAQNATAWNGAVIDNGGLGPNGDRVGPTDQRSQIRTFNVAPTWTHILNSSTVFSAGAFVRHDEYNYYPSGNPFADFQPDLQSQTISQLRFLTNAGGRASISYVKGVNNFKAGINFERTELVEHDNLGIVDPNFVASLVDASGNPCVNASGIPIASPCTDIAPFDLTSGGSLFHFRGLANVKELALYVQDTITEGNWSFNLGIRGDVYKGLTTAQQAEPRLGIAYNFKPSSTVLRLSYARTLETPFNENLILSSVGCDNPVLSVLLLCTPGADSALAPGFRNEFHAGFEQAIGKHLVVDADYIWKYTHGAYDFSVLGATPITFPIEWHNSKIPGFTARVNVPDYHGFTAVVVMSSVAARFFTPQIGGAGAAPSGISVFRIDHDEKFNQTAHVQYQPYKRAPWFGFNWRYDSGLVAGGVPFATDTTTPVDLTLLSADQQLQAGLFCGSRLPTFAVPLTTCVPSQYGSTRISIPAPGTENADRNPPRIASRSLFDLALGHDDLFHGDRFKWSARLTVINLSNKVALYNFLSTFSGTHFVTPRTFTGEIGFHF